MPNITTNHAIQIYKSQDSRLKFPGARSPDSLTWTMLIFFLSRFTFRFHLAVFITEMFLFLSETNPLFLENKKENWQESLVFKTSFLYRRDFFIPIFSSGRVFSGYWIWPKYCAEFGEQTKFFWRLRELTASLEERFAKVLARDTVLANKPVFWIEMTEIRDAESVVKKEGEMQD